MLTTLSVRLIARRDGHARQGPLGSEAVHEGWLELWYQPKIDARAIVMRGISLDDVGVEWTSLTDLRDFPFAEVKVDQSFIKGCAHDAVKQSMCRRIIELANGAGARTVAEGVETWADFLAVRALGFDLVQGFLFAEPAAAEQFARSCWTSTRHYLTSVLPSDAPTPLM